MQDEVLAIVNRIEEIIRNESHQPIDVLGSYIVGATIVRDDAETIFEAYPDLEAIADLGSELETLSGTEHAEQVFNEIEEEFADFKQKFEKDKA